MAIQTWSIERVRKNNILSFTTAKVASPKHMMPECASSVYFSLLVILILLVSVHSSVQANVASVMPDFYSEPGISPNGTSLSNPYAQIETMRSCREIRSTGRC